MSLRSLVIGMLALSLGALGVPALGGTPTVPPGNPCLMNNGNPCHGNNGNLGDQGNARHDFVRTDRHPPTFDIAMPPVSDRGVFISQIGDSNQASVKQSAPNAYARIDQNGNSNDADVAQQGTGAAYLKAAQTGDGNFARVQQSGSGQNVAYVTQSGNGNWLWSSQDALGAIRNGAQLTQNGDNNDMLLYQGGSDNLAKLTQDGDGNGMTAVQLGDGNRLAWTQSGNNLSDLKITQYGGSTQTGQLLITQTNSPPGR
jgi:Curlin associated repeat